MGDTPMTGQAVFNFPVERPMSQPMLVIEQVSWSLDSGVYHIEASVTHRGNHESVRLKTYDAGIMKGLTEFVQMPGNLDDDPASLRALLDFVQRCLDESAPSLPADLTDVVLSAPEDGDR